METKLPPSGRQEGIEELRARLAQEIERNRLLEERLTQGESDRQVRLYEAILTNTPDLAYVFDLDHRFVYANEGLLRMWGKSREEALGKNCLELGYEPWHAAMHDREIEQVIATKLPIRGEVPFSGTLGRRIYEYIFVPVFGPDGNVEAIAGTTRDVTERKQAEEQAHEASKVNARIWNLFEQGTHFAALLDLDGTVLEVNRFALEACGCSREEVVGKLFWDCAWWNPSTELSEMVRAGTLEAARGAHFRKETYYYLAGGARRQVDLKIAPVTDESGQVLFLSPTGVDITEKKEAEAALNENQRFLERITDVTPGLLQVYDIEHGQSVFANRSIPSFFGYTLEEVAELGPDYVTALMHPDDLPRQQAHVEAVRHLGDKEVADFEYRMRDRSGTWRWFQSRDAVFARDANGAPSQIIRAGVDITERKLAEAVQARLASIVDTSYDAIVSKNLDGIVLSWNIAAEHLFGYEASEIIGKSIAMIVPPDRIHEEYNILSSLRKGERCGSFDTKRLTKDGQLIDVSVTVSPLKDRNGIVIGASKIARDITESKRLKDQLKQTNEILEQRVVERTAQLEAFTYSIAHDMRMHIRGIKANIGMLRDDFKDLPNDLVAQLARIDASAGQMVYFVEGLLSYARTTNSPLKRSDVDLTRAANEVMARIVEESGATDIEFSVAERMSAVADPVLVGVVLQNLLDNAIKFRKPGRRLTIEIGPVEVEGGSGFFVRDNGIGFDQQYAAKVFQPFERLRNDPQTPGSGIGLANVRRILERHGGHIWVQSAVNEGSTFTFTFG